MPAKRKGGASLSIRLTPALRHHIHTIAAQKAAKLGRPVSHSEVVRDALRAHLDRQEDLAGSRRHFTREFRLAVAGLRWLLIVLLVMLAEIGSLVLLHGVFDLDAIAEQGGESLRAEYEAAYSGPGLLKLAMGKVTASGLRLDARLLELALSLEAERLAE